MRPHLKRHRRPLVDVALRVENDRLRRQLARTERRERALRDALTILVILDAAVAVAVSSWASNATQHHPAAVIVAVAAAAGFITAAAGLLEMLHKHHQR